MAAPQKYIKKQFPLVCDICMCNLWLLLDLGSTNATSVYLDDIKRMVCGRLQACLAYYEEWTVLFNKY